MFRKLVKYFQAHGGSQQLWIIFFTAFVFRFVLMLYCQLTISFDEAHYLRLAGSALEKGPQELLHPYWTPFYPGMIALLSAVIQNLEFSGRLINRCFFNDLCFEIK